MENLFLVLSVIIIQTILISILYGLYKTVAHPTVFLQIYITVQMILGIFAFNQYHFNYSGLVWILAASLFFTLGNLFFSLLIGNRVAETDVKYIYSINGRLAEKILIISILLGCILTLDTLINNGFSLKQLISIDSLIDINVSIANERYYGSTVVSKISRLFLVFTYFAPLAGGYNLNFFKNKKSRIICYLSMIPCFLIVLVQNTKSAWIAGVFLFISGYITSSIKINGKLRKISIRKFLFILMAMATFLLINYISMLMRVGVFNDSIIKIINDKFLLYALGHIPAFDIWFSSNVRFIEHSFGVKTFYGISNFIGISQRIQGVYTDIASWGEYSTNVYTVFRSFIEDFGVYLGLMIMAIYGFIINISFVSLKKHMLSPIAITLLAAFYFHSLYGFIISAWSYTSFIVVFIIFYIYIRSISKLIEVQ